MMKQLSVKELDYYLDDDLLKLLNKEDIRYIYLINVKIISNFEKFFTTFIPDSIKYFVVVSPDLPIKIIKESLARAKDALEVSCYISSKLLQKSMIVIGLQSVSKKEEVKEPSGSLA
ncbi:DUF4898 domain-containing protein [Sulfolobus sp. E5-1-F]|uniref:DUF4898 domain-containing protein n=1 Tax=Sulfolobaceae TaxID=118883 RepID=UPI0012976A74|nr:MULTISPECIES: DUF4898 domain-containing protein [unclassified Sulfolobus]QGA54131.1 DUF4898 domain-containing protein [Sulfolobus sp. E5-1-F]QGA69188.1 DUF4898 domain-containing protein [Sulfolobus sp. E11-6]